MTVEVSFVGKMSVGRCVSAYSNFYKVFKLARGNEVICLVSHRPIPSNITEISFSTVEKRPLYKVDMDMRMGKGYKPTSNSRHRKSVRDVSFNSLAITGTASVYSM